jgi:hypothetical protein
MAPRMGVVWDTIESNRSYCALVPLGLGVNKPADVVRTVGVTDNRAAFQHSRYIGRTSDFD